MTVVIILAVTFGAVFTQTLTGFGVSLVMMAFLVPELGVTQAAPLVAVLGLVLEVILLAYYRESLSWQAVKTLIVGAVVGVPMGLWGVLWLDERVTLTVLGGVLVGYGVYALLEFKLPSLSRPGLGYLFGFMAGLLGGAYNTLGPPVIIYGNCRRWPAREFKANLQGFFLFGSIFITIGHVISGNVTRPVLTNTLIALPAMLIAILIGLRFDKRIDPHRFRQLVLLVLIILGVRLLLTIS